MDLDILEGRVVDGRYRLKNLLGEGAMGAVYRAEQLVVDRTVAVKFMHPKLAEESDIRSRFEREAKALGQLDHPGCVRVYDFGWAEDLGSPYLVSEFVDGVDLLDRYAGADVRDFLRWGAEIAEAMAHAHGHGILHRDLKPENVLVSRDGEVKVVDFGLARIKREDEIRLTQEGQAHGTPAYMSPEQCQGGDVTTAVDVYALGCMLFEMFEDRLPFFGSTASAVLIKHVTEPVPHMSSGRASNVVEALIARMMQKAPEHRPTMQEVSEALRAELALLDAPGSASEPPPGPTTRDDASEPDAPKETTPAVRLTALGDRIEDPALQTDLVGLRSAGRRTLAVAATIGVLVAVGAAVAIGSSTGPPNDAVVDAPGAEVEPIVSGSTELAASPPAPAAVVVPDAGAPPPAVEQDEPTDESVPVTDVPDPEGTEKLPTEPRRPSEEPQRSEVDADEAERSDEAAKKPPKEREPRSKPRDTLKLDY